MSEFKQVEPTQANLTIARLAAEALCTFTRERLWQSGLASNALYLNHELRCRAGSGKSTYHRFQTAERQHLIVFGQKMVLDKWQAVEDGAPSLERWLTIREIRRRGFLNGEVTLESALLQTCLHEFAHLLQTVDRKRYRGSVHNEAFYAHLQNLHTRLDLNLARSHLRALLPPQLTASSSFQRLVEKPKNSRSNHLLSQITAGDLVSFQYHQQTILAVVLKRNRNTFRLQGKGAHSGMIYRCHPSLLTPVKSTSSDA